MDSDEALDAVDDVMEVDVEGEAAPGQDVQGQDGVPDKQSRAGTVPARDLVRKSRQSKNK